VNVEVLYEHCAGLDVHKKTVVACILHSGPSGTTVKETRTFSTMLPDLVRLRDWLLQEGCTHAAMEATGVYWKPVHNVLEGDLELLVVNAEHIKAVPGRKTDVKDAEWLATLLRHGLLKASFIPERRQRELRELTRFRAALVQDRVRVVNRLQKTLEGANIKLASVLSDITGVSGQRILDALLAGEDDPESLASLAHWRVQSKRGALEQALMGQLQRPLRFVVAQEMRQIRSLDEQIEACDGEVAQEMLPFGDDLERLDEVPGIALRGAQNILAETGSDLSRWPTPQQLTAWAGVCPGNKASGGKRRRAPARKGNPWLKRALTEAAWAAARTKNTYLGERFRRLRARIGPKRALVAVAREILTIIYYLLTRKRRFEELGITYLEQRDREALAKRAQRQLERLGYKVQLTAQAEVT
jgi:transposase